MAIRMPAITILMTSGPAFGARLGAVSLLVGLTAILPEMLSGNTPAETLFGTTAFVFFGLAYGLPILVIREWSARLGLSAQGLFVFGMAYGLINEGLLAKTIFRETGVPLDLFDHYGFAIGVNWPWTLFITIWHGMSSVVFPIALTHLAVPAFADRPWLGKRTIWVLSAVVVLLSSAFFLGAGASGPDAGMAELATLWAAMALLAFAGSRLRGRSARSKPVSAWKPFVVGLAGLPLMFVVLLVVRAAPPVPVYLAVLVAAAAIWVWLLGRMDGAGLPAFGRVAHGWYTQMAAFGWIAMVSRSPLTVILGALVLGGLHFLCRQAERRVAA